MATIGRKARLRVQDADRNWVDLGEVEVGGLQANQTANSVEIHVTGLGELRQKLKAVQFKLSGTWAGETDFARWIRRCYRSAMQRQRAIYMLYKLFGGGKN